jgi:hypothetical protein
MLLTLESLMDSREPKTKAILLSNTKLDTLAEVPSYPGKIWQPRSQ